MTSLESDFLTELKQALSKLRRADSGEASSSAGPTTPEVSDSLSTEEVSNAFKGHTQPPQNHAHPGQSTAPASDIKKSTPKDVGRRRIPDYRILKSHGFRRGSVKQYKQRPFSSNPLFPSARKDVPQAGKTFALNTSPLGKLMAASVENRSLNAASLSDETNPCEPVVVDLVKSNQFRITPNLINVMTSMSNLSISDMLHGFNAPARMSLSIRQTTHSEPATPTADKVLGIPSEDKLYQSISELHINQAGNGGNVPPPPEFTKNPLFGELNTVLQKRKEVAMADVTELETKLKTGKSIVYLGRGSNRESFGDQTPVVILDTTAEEASYLIAGSNPISLVDCNTLANVSRVKNVEGNECLNPEVKVNAHIQGNKMPLNAGQSGDLSSHNINQLILNDDEDKLKDVSQENQKNYLSHVEQDVNVGEKISEKVDDEGQCFDEQYLNIEDGNSKTKTAGIRLCAESTSDVSSEHLEKILKNPDSSNNKARPNCNGDSKKDHNESHVHVEQNPYAPKENYVNTNYDDLTDVGKSLNEMIVSRETRQTDSHECITTSLNQDGEPINTLFCERDFKSRKLILALQSCDVPHESGLLNDSFYHEYEFVENPTVFNVKKISNVNCLQIYGEQQTDLVLNDKRDTVANELFLSNPHPIYDACTSNPHRPKNNNEFIRERESQATSNTLKAKPGQSISAREPDVNSTEFWKKHTPVANLTCESSGMIARTSRHFSWSPSADCLVTKRSNSPEANVRGHELSSSKSLQRNNQEIRYIPDWKKFTDDHLRATQEYETVDIEKVVPSNTDNYIYIQPTMFFDTLTKRSKTPEQELISDIDPFEACGPILINSNDVLIIQNNVVDHAQETTGEFGTKEFEMSGGELSIDDSFSNTVASTGFSSSDTPHRYENTLSVSCSRLTSVCPVMSTCNTTLTPSSVRDSACPVSDMSVSAASDYILSKPNLTFLPVSSDSLLENSHITSCKKFSGEVHSNDSAQSKYDLNISKARAVHWTEEVETRSDISSNNVVNDRSQTCQFHDVETFNASVDEERSQEDVSLLPRGYNDGKGTDHSTDVPVCPIFTSRSSLRRTSLSRTISYQRGVPGPNSKLIKSDMLSSAFSTYPLLRASGKSSLPVVSSKDKDVITSLLITHSGEPIPSDSIDLVAGRAGRIHNGRHDLPLSVTVTIPEPTSFHQNGNRICQHLIGGKLLSGGGTRGNYNDRDIDMSKAYDKDKRTFVNCSDFSQKAVLDPCTLHYAFAPSGTVRGGRGGESGGRRSHGGTGTAAYSAGEESDLSISSFARDTHSYGKNWRLSSPNSYNIFTGNGGRSTLAANEQNVKSRRKTAKKHVALCASGGVDTACEALVCLTT